ncbi:MAG TPA: MlaE family lipid ABC transporter permease subunit [Candidatus Binataceae bacterium]|nr:MlaE family lipid ABC transporter permease subunit [Candidatus Binataceae bacterium]
MNLIEPIERFGEDILEAVAALGNFILFLAQAFRLIFAPPYKPRLAIRQVRTIGAESLLLVTLIATFTGMVLGLQGYNTLRRFGSEGALGTVVALTLVRELGPVLAALMIAARAGSAMAAELGAMQATEQVDALTVMAINPIQYLVSPRMLAGIITFPLLTSIFDVVGIWGGYFIGVGLMGAPGSSYMNGIAANLESHDIATGLYKALVFGVTVTWVCCYKGYYARRMATGVSEATTAAVVLSSILVLAFDFCITAIS